MLPAKVSVPGPVLVTEPVLAALPPVNVRLVVLFVTSKPASREFCMVKLRSVLSVTPV